jgi:hypothetical protein
MVDGVRPSGNNSRSIWVILAIAGIVVAEIWADPGANASSVDRIFSGAFVAFAVGFVELFIAMIALVILGRIDLPKVFQDKDGPVAVGDNPDGEPVFVHAVAGKGAVSLSRMQAFLWTLVIMVVWFHKAVLDGHGELPAMPSELLLVMGISGAVYLAGKELATRDARTVVVHKAGRVATAAAPGSKPDPAATRGADAIVAPVSAVPPGGPTAEAPASGQAARLELTGGAS